MGNDAARVPTSTTNREGWSLETAIDYLLSVINERHSHVLTRMEGNDKRYEERFTASQKALELGLAGTKSEIGAALVAADRAVLKAEVATEKRFESVNEFRATLDNQQRTLIPRSEVDVMMKAVEEKFGVLTKAVDKIEADRREQLSQQKGIQGGWGYAVGAIGFVLLVAAFMLRFVGP